MHSFETNQTVPAFLIKLWKLVEDPSCNDLIAWSDSGASFIIKDQTRFSKELLPQYFKHNNMASFIRQLNMYGFRKVMNYEKSGLRTENDEMEFQHSFFTKGQGAHLQFIKRKIPNNKVSEPPVKSNNARDILTDLSSIREKQESMDTMLMKMRKENESLWRELTNMRKKHKAQELVIQKVIQFLVSIVQRSNQNIGVQRKLPRMLHDSSNNQGNAQVTSIVDVLRNKNSNYITVPSDKLVSPPGPVIHEVTEFDHDHEENVPSPNIKSPGDKADVASTASENEVQEIECSLISCLNSPINASSAMEPLSILQSLQPNTPVLNNDEDPAEESVLGVPLDYISSPPINVISFPEEELCDNVISLPDSTEASFNPSMLVCTSSSKESDFDDSLLSESLQTPKIPTIHIEDINPPTAKAKQKNGGNSKKKSEDNQERNQLQLQNEHNYQLAVAEPSKSPALTKNTFSNHLINVEEEMKSLQDLLSSWNSEEANNLLGLFSADDVANNEAIAGEMVGHIDIKTEPTDCVGNELVHFNSNSTLNFDNFDLENTPLFEGISQEAEIPLEDATKVCEEQKNFLGDALIQADQMAASEAADFLLNNESSPKQKSIRRPKVQKSQKTKRRKIK